MFGIQWEKSFPYWIPGAFGETRRKKRLHQFASECVYTYVMFPATCAFTPLVVRQERVVVSRREITSEKQTERERERGAEDESVGKSR